MERARTALAVSSSGTSRLECKERWRSVVAALCSNECVGDCGCWVEGRHHHHPV